MISLRDVVTGFGNRDPLAEVWRRNLRGGGGGAAEITGVLPLRYIGDGRPLTDYRIAGNAVQDGTPSSDAPVNAAGCGAWDEAQQSYKLPLTVNGTEYPIYLGQVETTRRIKKLVLTGKEGWVLSTAWKKTATSVFYTALVDIVHTSADNTVFIRSNAFAAATRNELYNGNSDMVARTGTESLTIRISDDIATTVADFKSYLTAQYANGTPITVWYVLAEPETAIVNEPLMKIGDYADTVSFAQAQVTIPTVNGENVLDMASPVKPSEVYIKGKGIKPTGYGQLVDVNGVNILDKNDVRILVHGQ